MFAKITILSLLAGLFFAAAVFLPAGEVSAEKLTRTVMFEKPDIRDDFCGARIDYRICKCARHNEMCEDIGRERHIANYILNAKYNAHVAALRASFIASCHAAGGRFSGDACRYFEKTGKETQCLPGDFERNWKKYSDIDDAIPVPERSAEAKEHYEALSKMVANAEAVFLLERDMEIDRRMRLEMKEYKQALANNIKTNLLKSFWRLAWITYDNIQSGRASGGTFEKMYDLPSHVESVAAYIKIVRSVTPADSAIAINTEKVSGKVKSVGLSAALDALESVGDPATVATTLISESIKQTFPSADITPEEIEILKNQHLKNKLLDDILQESYRKNAERRRKADALAAENERLKDLLFVLEAQERERVHNEILESCKK
ncbi:MAG: hypothetical protein AAB581_00970 [Patescibacteria group bacterium]